MGMKVCLWFSVPVWSIKALVEREKAPEWGFLLGKFSEIHFDFECIVELHFNVFFITDHL